MISALVKKCKASGSNIAYVLLAAAYYKLFYGKLILAHQKVTIRRPQHIQLGGTLQLGIEPVGFVHRYDRTFLNIEGKLHIAGNFSIGRGCRIAVGEHAEVSIGQGGYINANTRLIIMHKLEIGNNCNISWDCQLLDEDFHTVNYPGKKPKEKGITIGDNVWIGCGAKIYQGTVIPAGCIIAADAVVRGVFTLENCIIGGNPARVIRENASWS